MISVSFPGKLFLMGEYAVMESGYPSVVMSVPARLFVNLKSTETWSISSTFGDYHGNDVFSMATMPEVSASLNVLSEFLQRPLKPAHIEIISQLDEGDRKYGFGSSGVVIVAVVSAILKHEEYQINKLELFKLCVLVQRSINGMSSGGDLAAAIYDDVLIYCRYDLKWLMKQNADMATLVHNDWPLLKIDKLNFLYDVCIGWTGKSNKTSNYLTKVNEQRLKDPLWYDDFLAKAKECVEQFVEGNYPEYAIHVYRNLMIKLGTWADIDIETVELRDLIDSAEAIGYPAKVSGSGGGDCGFALVPKGDNVTLLKKVWEMNNIKMI